VRYKVEGNRLTAEVDRPAALPGVFVWKGKPHPLINPRTRLELVR